MIRVLLQKAPNITFLFKESRKMTRLSQMKLKCYAYFEFHYIKCSTKYKCRVEMHLTMICNNLTKYRF